MEVVIQKLSIDTGKFHSEAGEKLDHIVRTASAQITPIDTLISATAALHTRLDSFSSPEPTSPVSPTQPPPYQVLGGQGSPTNTHRAMDRGNIINIQASCYKRTCRPWCSCKFAFLEQDLLVKVEINT